MDTSGVFDEALERLHGTGPEFDGWLTNHGPMAVEALARHGQAGSVHHWLDVYEGRLDEAPRPGRRITGEDWREALGDPKRLGDWPVYFGEQLRDRPWREVLTEWWPRLLPGLAGGATHVVIRTGHAVRALLESADGTPPAPRLAELAQALGYWGARYQELPAPVVPAGALPAAEALAAIPGVPRQTGGIRPRLDQLTAKDTPGWPRATSSLRAPATPEEARDALTDLVRAATHRYATHAHGSPVMLVHAATAPNAVLRTLPALPRELWAPSHTAAWSATAAILAAYGPNTQIPAPPPPTDGEELLARAASHGDEHAIKLVDTALDVADPKALSAGEQAVTLIDPLL